MSMMITMSLVIPGAGTTQIAYGDGHGATFQIGVYEPAGADDDRRPHEAPRRRSGGGE
jgi:hypothetical protein